ncbi:MAG: FAD-dependent oxidoreductase [Candidatus Omnitrophica bacterium]|nr:FAD-dependent oxidoreductase [Candidatus Omnitrophota bacterium]MBU4345928.1 FAD-dependent oxidoreductase [Candidatus Omnitrophota bacterium]MCG2706488.1 FAD-dependent oxidoreductase [Candidatus Omnitrophota bacterium]
MAEFKAGVLDIIQRTYNVKSFRLSISEDVDFKPGQFLQATIKVDQRQISHYLSISNSPTEKGYIEFTKKITESEFSQALNKLKPTDSVNLKYPYGTFTFQGEYKKIVFLSGGIGITPIRSITKYVVDKKLDIDIVLIYGNRTIKDIAFQDDFDKMQKQYPGFKVVHVLSQAEAGWPGRTGHINAGIIKEEIPDFAQRKFFICGPPVMVEAMRRILLDELSLSEENIIIENFSGY